MQKHQAFYGSIVELNQTTIRLKNNTGNTGTAVVSKVGFWQTSWSNNENWFTTNGKCTETIS